MPAKKSSKKPKFARKFKNFVSSTRIRPEIKVSPSPIVGNRLYSKLIYTETGLQINPGIGGAAAAWVFNLSSLFDPSVTGVGHQPTGYDQLMAIYEQYIVYKVDYKLSLMGPDDTVSVIHGVSLQDQVAVVNDPRQYMENGNTQWRVAGGDATSSGYISTFSGTVDIAAMHGQTMAEYMGDDVNKGTISTSPVESMYLHAWAAPADASTDLANQLLVAELVFYCVFTGGKLNTLS